MLDEYSFKESSRNSLESQVFLSPLEKTIFTDWLRMHSYIIPVFESREAFNARKGDMLVPGPHADQSTKPIGNFWVQILYVPENINIKELPAIIRRINTATFSENMPNYASTKEMQIKIVLIVDSLLKRISSITEPDELNNTRKALTKYYILYGDLTSDVESQKLWDLEYRNKYLLIANGGDKYQALQKKIVRIRTAEEISNLHSEMESLVSRELVRHLNESIFEHGIGTIYQWLETITKAEQEAIRSQALKDWFVRVDSNTFKKWGEVITLQTETRHLETESKLLRNAVWIDGYKKSLDTAREKGDNKEIIKIELEATRAIARELYKYPYRLVNSNNWFTPRGAMDHKEIYCVGFSLIGHAMLSELGIKHQWLDIPEHSALSVDIGWKSYYMDSTIRANLPEYIYSRPTLQNPGIAVLIGEPLAPFQIFKWDPEIILQKQMYGNMIDILWRNGRHIEAETTASFGNLLNDYTEQNVRAYFQLGVSLLRQKKYTEGISIFRKLIRMDILWILTPRDYQLIALTLNTKKLEGYEQDTILALQRSIENDPDKEDGKYYFKLGSALDLYLGSDWIGDLIKSIYVETTQDKTKPYNVRLILEKYKKEHAEIRKYIKKRDYEGLRVYVMKIVDARVLLNFNPENRSRNPKIDSNSTEK